MQKSVFFPGLFAYVHMYRFNAEKFEYAVLSFGKFLDIQQENSKTYF